MKITTEMKKFVIFVKIYRSNLVLRMLLKRGVHLNGCKDKHWFYEDDFLQYLGL